MYTANSSATAKKKCKNKVTIDMIRKERKWNHTNAQLKPQNAEKCGRQK